MARGFAAGLFQGAVLCGAGLVILSLAMPQPPRPQMPGAAPQSAQSGADGDPAGLAAESLSVPAGSEFARGSDMQPQAPQPLTEAPRIAAAPVVARPEDETAPAASEAERLRPEARGEAPAAPEIALPEVEPIDLPDPAGEAPIPVPPPGKVVVPVLDRAPDRAPERAPERTVAEPDRTPPSPAPQDAPAAAEAVAESPAAVAPGPEAPVDAAPQLPELPLALDGPPTAPEIAAPETAPPEPAIPEPATPELALAPGAAPPQPAAAPAPQADPQPADLQPADPQQTAAPDLSLPPGLDALLLNDRE